MEIIGNKSSIYYNENNATLYCKGTLEKRGREGYHEIAGLLEQVVLQEPAVITLDIRELEFLNSSGITTLGGFIIRIRKRGVSRLKIICSDRYAWQTRSVKGLQKLLPEMELVFGGPEGGRG